MNGDETSRRIAAKMALNPAIRSVQKRIENGTATFEDASRYVNTAAQIMGDEFAKDVLNLSSSDRQRVCGALLQERYSDTFELLSAIQRLLDRSTGVQLAPQKPEYPAERVQQMAQSLTDETVPDETIRRRAGSTATIARSFQDAYMQENAKFRSKAGLKCYITRTGAAGCCKWCAEVAGKFLFGEEPDGLFRRHDNCDCTIIYNGQKLRGKYDENGRRTKTWEEVPDNAGAEEPVRFSAERAAELEAGNSLTKPADSAIMAREESPRKSRGGSFEVDWAVVQSAEYSSKFDKLSDNPTVSRAIETRARWALNNRTRTQTEELYAVSLTSGREIARITDQHYRSGVRRTPAFTAKLNKADTSGDRIMLLHNHPRGLPPSISDINALLKNENVSGITVGHNGTVYRYTRPNREISLLDWDVELRKFSSFTESTSMEKALEALSEKFGFEFEIL